MFRTLKRLFFFPVAYYFVFFARIKFNRWRPRVIVLTGSSGKTTLLSFVESQLLEKAKYSHHANSALGVPFDILGLSRKTLKKYEWIGLFLQAPFKTFSKIPEEKLYVVEADCDRPGEGKFLATFLRPEVTLWISTSKTHSMNFDGLVQKGKYQTVEEAIAYEFGYFLEYSQKLCIIDKESALMEAQVKRTSADILRISQKQFGEYAIDKNGTTFTLKKKTYHFPYLFPQEIFYTLSYTLELLFYLAIDPDVSFAKLTLPPGRCSLFDGIKHTLLIDSTYNTSFSSMVAILFMFEKMPHKTKWIVLGDMLELGKSEKEEHEKLADVVGNMHIDRLVLLGPRISRYTYPLLKNSLGKKIPVVHFENPKEVLDYLITYIQGEELILFKGVRFLEGVIEHLLKNKEDAKKLSRREQVWEERRRQWGL